MLLASAPRKSALCQELVSRYCSGLPCRRASLGALVLRHILSLIVCVLVVASQSQGQKTQVYELLDREDAAATKTLLAMDSADLMKAIRKGRPEQTYRAGREKRKLSDGLGRESDLYLVVPKQVRGVLILLHGLGGNGRQLRDRFYTKFAAENGLILACPSAKKIPKDAKNEDDPLNTMRHWWSYRDQGFAMRALETLKREFPIDEDRVYISGYSMGGFGSWNIGLRYNDRFAAAVPFAGGLSCSDYVSMSIDKKSPRLLVNAAHLPSYFVHGDADRTVPVKFDRRIRDRLVELEYAHTYVEVEEGTHFLPVREGGELMAGVQDWLKGKTRDAHPRRLRFASLGAYMSQSHWLRIDEFSDEVADLQAQIDSKTNSIRIEGEGAKALSLYIDESLLDIARPIQVVHGEKTLFEGKVKPSSEVLLESWRAREDRQLLYRAKVSVSLDAD